MNLINWKRTVTIALIVVFTLTIAGSHPALAADTPNGAKIFSVNCAGCHSKGGNIIRRGKNLKQKALHRYSMDSIEAISSLVANGKNSMPAYSDRLNKQQIEAVATYVLEQAQDNWRSK